MKVTEIWKTKKGPTISFELFPAKSEKAELNLNKTIDKLAELNPDFVSVTFGAGGSTKKGSFQLVDKLKNEKNLELIAYFACWGLGPGDIIAVLDSYQSIGVQNILAVRGDIPREEGFSPHPESLIHASDLVSFIRPRYDFCIGVAGYPEGHVEASSKDKDIEFLKYKVDQGAEYIIANYFYDNKYFFNFLERCAGADIRVPILPGVMPIYSMKMLKILADLCGATITEKVKLGLTKIPEDDKEGLVKFGIEFATNQCRELLKAGVPGLHIYTMDRSKSAVGIVSQLREERLL